MLKLAQYVRVLKKATSQLPSLKEGVSKALAASPVGYHSALAPKALLSQQPGHFPLSPLKGLGGVSGRGREELGSVFAPSFAPSPLLASASRRGFSSEPTLLAHLLGRGGASSSSSSSSRRAPGMAGALAFGTAGLVVSQNPTVIHRSQVPEEDDSQFEDADAQPSFPPLPSASGAPALSPQDLPTFLALAGSPAFMVVQSLLSSPAMVMVQSFEAMKGELTSARDEAVELQLENRALKERVQVLEDSRLCGICCTNPRNVVYNCHHVYACQGCDERLKEEHLDCPVCRSEITSRVHFIPF